MARFVGTSQGGRSFDHLTVEFVWQKAQIVPGSDPRVVRKDCCGAWIWRERYGQTEEYGWEIDHIRPVSAGGTDDLANLQPLHWKNNRGKSDSWPNWTCSVSAA